MPRPITKADIKRWRERYSFRLVARHDPVLGIYVSVPDYYIYPYSANFDGSAKWVNKKTLERRKRIGHPKKRVKQMLRGDMFSLDEMSLAESVMAELSDGL